MNFLIQRAAVVTSIIWVDRISSISPGWGAGRERWCSEPLALAWTTSFLWWGWLSAAWSPPCPAPAAPCPAAHTGTPGRLAGHSRGKPGWGSTQSSTWRRERPKTTGLTTWPWKVYVTHGTETFAGEWSSETPWAGPILQPVGTEGHFLFCQQANSNTPPSPFVPEGTLTGVCFHYWQALLSCPSPPGSDWFWPAAPQSHTGPKWENTPWISAGGSAPAILSSCSTCSPSCADRWHLERVSSA